MANFEITNPIYLVNKASSVDSLYGTYPTLAAAETTLTPLALPGRLFAVQETGQPVKLYVWQGAGVAPTPAGRTDFIPLTGTIEGKPFVGNLELKKTAESPDSVNIIYSGDKPVYALGGSTATASGSYSFYDKAGIKDSTYFIDTATGKKSESALNTNVFNTYLVHDHKDNLTTARNLLRVSKSGVEVNCSPFDGDIASYTGDKFGLYSNQDLSTDTSSNSYVQKFWVTNLVQNSVDNANYIPLEGNTSSNPVTGVIHFDKYENDTTGSKGIKFNSDYDATIGVLSDESDQWVSLLYDYKGTTPSDDMYTDVAVGNGFIESVVRVGEDGFNNNAKLYIDSELNVRLSSTGKEVSEINVGQAGISHVGNFTSRTTWTNPSLQMTALPDKSTDATYNLFMGMDGNGNIAKFDNAINAFIKTMQTASDAQKDAWRTANRKTGEVYSVGQPRVDTILPPIIDNTKDYIQYVTLVGLNLFVNNGNPSTASVSIVRYKDINNQLIAEETHIIDNYQVYQANTSILSFGIDYSLFPTGYYKVKVIHNGLENIGTSDILVTTQVTTKPIVLDNWEIYTPYDASSLVVSPTSIKKTYTTNRGSSIIEQQVKHFIITEEDVIRGFRVNFTYKLTPTGTELTNVYKRSSVNFGLGYDKAVDGTIVPEILISFFRGNITIGNKASIVPTLSVPIIYDVDIVIKNGLATVILNCRNNGSILTNTFSFEQLNQKMYFYSTFFGSNADTPIQITGTTQELLFANTYQTFFTDTSDTQAKT